MKTYLKILALVTIVAAITVVQGCASSNNPSSNNSSAGKPSTVHAEQRIKDEILKCEILKSEILNEEVLQKEVLVAGLEVEAKRKHFASKAQHPVYAQSQLASSPSISTDHQPQYYQETGRENYAAISQSAVKQVSSDPVSTFSIDVDTGSYTNVRRMLNQGYLPPVDAVRVEEMINYFDYAYQVPNSQSEPFSINTELAQSPWSSDHVLLQVALKGYELIEEERPAANLVFLLDVSGSMNSPQKLPLLKKSLILLSKQLNSQDKVSIVVYAGASGVVLEPTSGNQTLEIEQALEKLTAGGSTNGQSGIQLAYQLAKKEYVAGGINRVILATDGDFNVGTRNVESLKKLIGQKRKQGIALTTLGFGTGNYNDELMEQLADVGNGNYAYIDNLNEARKVLVEELSSTLLTIAQDVKIQIEFNPEIVKEYRLLGYENRALKREDFNNDRVDAGDIGAGHAVTALYELVLQTNTTGRIDPLRYPQTANKEKTIAHHSDSVSAELAFIKFRFKELNATKSQFIARPIHNPEQVNAFDKASIDFRFAATVAEFGEVLRQSKYIETVDYNSMIKHALQSKGSDPFGYRSEFIQLLRLASNL